MCDYKMCDYKICNGQITNTHLGVEDHGIFTIWLTLKFDGSVCSFGGYAFDQYDRETEKRVFISNGMSAIAEILECLDLTKWEELPNTFVRVEHSGWGGKITRIGNLMRDQWFSFEEFFSRNQPTRKIS